MARVSRSEVAHAVKNAVTRATRVVERLQARAIAKARPVDALETEPAPPDGKAFVAAALKDIAARTSRGEKVRVVFDIDDTLVDTRRRTLLIAKAWDETNGTHYFDCLTLEQVGHDGLDTAKAFGLPSTAERAFAEHWLTEFWDPDNFELDAPIPQVIALAKAAKAAKAEVVFLTGRTQGRQAGSIAELKGFGLEADEKNVVCKPNFDPKLPPEQQLKTSKFKTDWVQQSEADGYHLGFFFTESKRDIAAIQNGIEGAPIVLLDNFFTGNETILPDTPVWPRPL